MQRQSAKIVPRGKVDPKFILVFYKGIAEKLFVFWMVEKVFIVLPFINSIVDSNLV